MENSVFFKRPSKKLILVPENAQLSHTGYFRDFFFKKLISNMLGATVIFGLRELASQARKIGRVEFVLVLTFSDIDPTLPLIL